MIQHLVPRLQHNAQIRGFMRLRNLNHGFPLELPGLILEPLTVLLEQITLMLMSTNYDGRRHMEFSTRATMPLPYRSLLAHRHPNILLYPHNPITNPNSSMLGPTCTSTQCTP